MTTFERLQRLINLHLSIDLDKIKEDSHLFNDLNFDSLDAIEMILEMEEEFDIEIPDDIVDELLTIPQVISFIDENS
jgi:acyl carrier protein